VVFLVVFNRKTTYYGFALSRSRFAPGLAVKGGLCDILLIARPPSF
jgi:hypothetical protein